MSYLNPSISSANQVLTLSVTGLFPAPVTISGFSTDRYYSSEAVEVSQAVMGVDGRLTGGVVRNPIPMQITLQADSASRGFFRSIYDAMEASGDVYWLNGTVSHPATGEAYQLTRGLITKMPKFPAAGKTLEPLTVDIVWQSSVRTVI